MTNQTDGRVRAAEEINARKELKDLVNRMLTLHRVEQLQETLKILFYDFVTSEIDHSQDKRIQVMIHYGIFMDILKRLKQIHRL
jgi:ABC-type iron transport system FetAB ATPase subunit